MKNRLVDRRRFIRFETSIYLAFLLITGSTCGAGDAPADAAPPLPAVRGPYFGQKPPGKTPEIFAPGILSLANRMEARIAFSPDGNECFFTVPNDFTFSNVQMYYTKRVGNVWTPQALAPFSLPGFSCAQPFFSADGNKLYFTSNRNGTGTIWVVERTAQGWGDPEVLPGPINCADGAGEYSQTTDGTAYFESARPGRLGVCDVWRVRPPQPGQPLRLENLGAPINSGTCDSDPYISPDGRYLIFASYRSGGCGGADLYVTFANGNGGWTAPVNLNEYCPGINTAAIEYGASLSPDGRFLFFVRLDPGARQCDVYWVENPFRAPTAAKPAQVTGPYFGQKPPGEKPEIFAAELLSARYGFVARIAFSPDGTECFFTVTDATFSRPRIFGTQRHGDIWSEPIVAPFTLGHVSSNEPFFSPDGTKLYFSSDESGKSATNRRDIWVVERTPQGWGNLRRLPPPLNSEYTELFFSQAVDGTIYFISNRPGGLGGFDLYRTRQEPGQPMRIENLGAPLNSPDDEWDPCIAPDGSFLVFASTRPGGRGGSDLYVSFNDGHGGLTAPLNLGGDLNSPADEYAPSLSPDGRFLFFTRHDGKRGDIYWVAATVLERFRTKSH